jgi:signal transduction histidine kinase
VYKHFRQSLTDHPLAVDITIALAIAMLLAAGSIAGGLRDGRQLSSTLFPALLVGLVALPLCVRRVRPRMALAGTLIFAALAFGLSTPLPPTVLPIAVALYTIGARGDRRSSLIAVGVSVASILLIRLVFAYSTGYAEGVTRDIGWIFGSSALGYAVASRRAYVEQFKQRAIEAERTREEEAQRRVDEERLRIARDVHDGVAHALASISLQASAASAVLDSDPVGAREALQQIRGTSVSALAELRATLGVLRQTGQGPRAPGFIEVTELANVLRAGGIEVSVRQEGGGRPLPTEVGNVAYRILQEALTNVLRHSGAGHADVTVRQDEATMLIVVADDGRGPVPGSEQGKGYGITGMRERAASVGGSLEVGPHARGGFVVKAVLPLTAVAG